MWKIVDVLRDIDQRMKWDKTLRDVKKVHIYNEQTFVLGSVGKGQYPVSDRTFSLVLANWKTNAGHFLALSFDTETPQFSKPGAVEGSADMIAWYLTPVDFGHTKIVSFFKCDLKIEKVPIQIISLFSRKSTQLPLAVVKYINEKEEEKA